MELKKQEEREKDRLIREQLSKEKKEREEAEKLRKEIEEAEEKERIHQQELDKTRRETALAEGEKRRQLEIRLKQLEQQVAQDRSLKEDAILRSRRLKSGFIYVISSIGSFEQGIYRICMTQSNDPDKYIKDMNPVVPFPFYIHFKVFSEDVSDTLKRLHELFDGRRVNKINPRREFFRVSLEEIDRAISKIANETGMLKNIQRFETIPLENEYLRTRAFERKDNSSFRTNDSYKDGGIA